MIIAKIKYKYDAYHHTDERHSDLTMTFSDAHYHHASRAGGFTDAREPSKNSPCTLRARGRNFVLIGRTFGGLDDRWPVQHARTITVDRDGYRRVIEGAAGS